MAPPAHLSPRLRLLWRARDGDEGGERGPASIYCDLCRDEVKRAQAALRAQAYRQRKARYGGVVRLTHYPWPSRRFRRDTETVQ